MKNETNMAVVFITQPPFNILAEVALAIGTPRHKEMRKLHMETVLHDL